LDQKTQNKDIYISAISVSIKELNDKNATKLIAKINPQLVKGLDSPKTDAGAETVYKCLEIMGSLYKKFHILLYREERLIDKSHITKKLCDL
jgi:hypothetical protein